MSATATLGPSPVPSVDPAAPLKLDVKVLATGLTIPWAVAEAPDGRIFFTERGGRVRLFVNGSVAANPVLTLPVAASGEGGLLGLALDPGFPSPAHAYVYYTRSNGSGLVDRISRFTVNADSSFADEKPVVDSIPAGTAIHFGGRIRFGPDGLLYAGVGDAQQPARAADPASLDGKVIRVRPDGSAPPEVFALGLRNPQGLAWDPAGRLYASDNGPTGEYGLCCHDEIDLLRQGAWYGWPDHAGNVDTGAGVNPPSEAVAPLVESGTSVWAPSGAAYYAGTPPLAPSLLVATLKGQAVRRFVLDGNGGIVRQEVAVSGYGRMRDVAVEKSGCLLLLTSNRDGRGSPVADDDRMLRACPA